MRRSPLSWTLAASLTVCLSAAGGLLGPIGAQSLSFPATAWHVPAGRFILLFASMWVASIGLLILFPRERSTRDAFARIMLLALVVRLFLLPQPPSDDIYRYLWEGRLVSENISPYRHAPNDRALSALAAEDPHHPRINHPDLTAAYPPLTLLLFAAVGKVSYDPAAMKILALLADMATLAMLLRLLAHRGLDPRWAILYAFNPVVLIAFAGQGHFDSLQGFFLTAALFLYDRRKWKSMFAMAGLAVGVKYVAVLVVPFLLRRDNLRHGWAGLATLSLPLLPFLMSDGLALFASLDRFASLFAFNGSVHGILRALFGQIEPATALCRSLLAATLAAGVWVFHPERSSRFRDDPVSGAFFAVGALLALSPTVHFWYLAWALIFLPLRPTLSWIVLSLTAGFYFVAVGMDHETGRFYLPPFFQGALWAPFWILLVFEGVRFFQRLRAPIPQKPPCSVSVIIPALNEAGTVAATVKSALEDPAVCEVILVDGGSTDRTRHQAQAAGARVVDHAVSPQSGGGRGGQIREGLLRAKGDAVAVVHADTVVEAPGFTRILDVLGKAPGVSGGALGGRFDGTGWRLRLVEWANDLRAAFFGISFGDQVQFFRREPVVSAGLFPAIALMEDVELSLRLQRLGRVTFLFGSAVISGRRWKKDPLKRTGLVLKLFFSYLFLRLWGKVDPVIMYYRYYGKGADSKDRGHRR